MWRVFELTNKNWLLVFSLAIIGGCSVYLIYRYLRRLGLGKRKLSWYLNKIWNLGHNNEDANFDWWEWYGPHLVKRYWKRRMGRFIKELAGSPKSLISLGCGSSPIINMFQSRVVGIEIEPDKVAFMRKWSNADLIVGDITKMEPVGRFEVVLCNEVLEHLQVDGLDGTIKLLTGYLEENGKLVISFPDYGSWYGRLLERLVHGSLHTKEFTKADLVNACSRVGLSLVAERRFLWDTCVSFQRS